MDLVGAQFTFVFHFHYLYFSIVHTMHVLPPGFYSVNAYQFTSIFLSYIFTLKATTITVQTGSNSRFAYSSKTFSHTHSLKTRRVCKVRQCIHSGKVHAEENGGAMSGFFLASKSRLGCRLVCPYSAQTCQTFQHQYE